MKKAWKWLEDNCLNIILVFLWAYAILFILVLLDLETTDRIQAASVVTLVFVTLFYVMITHRLVKQGRVATELDRQMRIGIYADEKLQEFFYPVASAIVYLREHIKNFFLNSKSYSDEEFKKQGERMFASFNEVYDLLSKNLYLIPPGKTENFFSFMEKFLALESQDFQDLEKTVIDMDSWLDDFSKIVAEYGQYFTAQVRVFYCNYMEVEVSEEIDGLIGLRIKEEPRGGNENK